MTTTPLPPWIFERVIDGIPCVPTVEAENNMQIYAIAARADLEAENKRLREALRIAHGHIDMNALRVSHCKDAATITAALEKQP